MKSPPVNPQDSGGTRDANSDARRDTLQKENPYATLDVADSEPVADRLPPPTILLWLWPIAVLINLPVPWWMGWDMARHEGRWFGMPVGITIWLAAGAWLIHRIPTHMVAMMCGSIVVAISQFWPMAHLWIGMFACAISRGVCGDPEGMRFHSTLGVVLVTLLTGVGLILLSLVIGKPLLFLFRLWWSATDPNK
jgi:hypothetical protein